MIHQRLLIPGTLDRKRLPSSVVQFFKPLLCEVLDSVYEFAELDDDQLVKVGI